MNEVLNRKMEALRQRGWQEVKRFDRTTKPSGRGLTDVEKWIAENRWQYYKLTYIVGDKVAERYRISIMALTEENMDTTYKNSLSAAAIDGKKAYTYFDMDECKKKTVYVADNPYYYNRYKEWLNKQELFYRRKVDDLIPACTVDQLPTVAILDELY